MKNLNWHKVTYSSIFVIIRKQTNKNKRETQNNKQSNPNHHTPSIFHFCQPQMTFLILSQFSHRVSSTCMAPAFTKVCFSWSQILLSHPLTQVSAVTIRSLIYKTPSITFLSLLQKLYHLQLDKYSQNILSVPPNRHPHPKFHSILTRLNHITEMPWAEVSTLISPACLSPVELDWASPPFGFSDDFWLTAPTGDSHPWLWYVHKELSFKAIMEKIHWTFTRGIGFSHSL